MVLFLLFYSFHFCCRCFRLGNATAINFIVTKLERSLSDTRLMAASLNEVG